MTDVRVGRLHLKRAGAAMVLLASAAAALSGCRGGEDALVRGDELWAGGDRTSALAEYRLALRQSGGDVQVLRRVAHAYVESDQLERGRETYDRLLARAPAYSDQAVYDYIRFAARRLERGDRHGMGAALDAALELRPDLPLADFALPMGRYYRETGQTERALAFYERTLASMTADSAPRVLYEIGLIHRVLGNCLEAIRYLEEYQHHAPDGEMAGEARWNKGQCAFELGREARQTGQLTRALGYMSLVVELGVPENVQDQAWFEQGEVLFALGQYSEALAAYRRVLELNPARTGQLVERAQRRIDEIRFR